MQWRDRGYMPHVDGEELIQHVSYHLADSLPKEALERMAAETKSLPPKLRDTEKEKRIAAYLDAGKGSCVLRVPEIAELVQNSLLLFHGERYILHAWCVMPNHVHVLFQPVNGWSMSKIVSSWKSFTGRKISAYVKGAGLEPVFSTPAKLAPDEPTAAGLATFQRGSTVRAGLEPGEPSGGPPNPNRIWHREYWDRYIRDHVHYMNAVNYIHNNPVKAMLVAAPEDWKWSSANAAGLEPGEPSE